MARGVFASDRLALVEQYAALLADDAVVRGLIGPREVPRLWDRHVLNCAVLSDAFPPGTACVADLGSGAGLPGLVVAIRRPDLEVSLVEPLLRRAAFLDEVVERLELGNVHVVRARAEELHGSASFDVVTSRAVAPLPRLLGWSMPLVAARGSLVVMKGSRVHEELAGAASDLATWQVAAPRVSEVGADVVEVPTTVLEVSWADPERVGWPSRPTPGPARVTSGARSGRKSRSGRRHR